MKQWFGDLLRRFDQFQRRRSTLGFVIAAARKFGEDKASNLAALIAYFGFVAIFPSMLVLVTVLQIVLRHDPALQQRLVNSALHAYPIVGQQLKSRVHPLSGTGLALAVGLIGALIGASGVARAIQNALGSVWAVPQDRRPAFPWSALRAVALLIVIGVGQIVVALLSGVAGGLGHVISGPAAEVGAIALSFAANIGVFHVTFKLALGDEVSWRDLRLAAVLSAASWQVLLVAGSVIIGRLLHHSSALYGVFGVVLGMLAWLYLQAQITLYAVEAAAVRTWRAWPRSLAPPPTEADQRAYEHYERSLRPPPEL